MDKDKILREALENLLNCAELNQEELESATLHTISKARTALEETSK